MAISLPNFPDPNVQTEWQNPDTLEYYDYNPTTGAWRRRSGGGGGGPLIPDVDGGDAHQDGTLDDRYVEVSGDVMEGDLILHPSEEVDPNGTGNLVTTAPQDDAIELRYQGSDDVVRCVTFDLGPCVTKTSPQIQIDGTIETTADYDDVISVKSDGTVEPGGTLSSSNWEKQNPGESNWSVLADQQTSATYTVVAEDQSSSIRLCQKFDVSGEEVILYSNEILVTNVDPPVVNWFSWTNDDGLDITLTWSNGNDHEMYKYDTGASDWVSMGSKRITVNISSLAAGTYVIESTGLSHIELSGNIKAPNFTIDENSYLDDLTSAQRMFYKMNKFNQDLSWLFGGGNNITNWRETFSNCNVYNQPVAGFVTSAATDCFGMFRECAVFDQLLTGWDTTNVKNLSQTFKKSGLNQDITGLALDSCENASEMLAFTPMNQSLNGLTFKQATNVYNFMGDCSDFNADVSGVQGIDKLDMLCGFFFNCKKFNQNIDGWDVSNIQNFARMLDSCSVFDQSLASWDTSKATNLDRMFRKAAVFNQPLNTFNTSNVTNLRGIFVDAYLFNQPVGSWNTGNVVCMYDVFYGCRVFNQNVNNWNTSKVTNMSGMFTSAKDYNQPMEKWDTSNVTKMENMFKTSQHFAQDISNWCVPNISVKPSNFDSGTTYFFENEPDVQPQWGTCPPRILTSPVIK